LAIEQQVCLGQVEACWIELPLRGGKQKFKLRDYLRRSRLAEFPQTRARWHRNGTLCDPGAEMRRENALTRGVALLIELRARKARALAPRR
jgi:hypothetical protein